MKRIILAVLGVLTVSAGADAQSTAQMIEKALTPAPTAPRVRDAITVIKWNADHTYETLREGTNDLVCYDRSGAPGRAAFAVQCTVLGNLDRVAQNRRFEAEGGDRRGTSALVNAAVENGTRVPVIYGSVWIAIDGEDQASAHLHTTIAVPGATMESSGFSESFRGGGIWIMGGGTDAAHLMIPDQPVAH